MTKQLGFKEIAKKIAEAKELPSELFEIKPIITSPLPAYVGDSNCVRLMKQPRLKLPAYLDAVRNHVTHCVKCGATEGLDVAHYSGLYANRLGKGTGSKCHDYAVARLCRDCHIKMDSYAEGNGEERAMDFIEAIYQTMRVMALAEINTTPTPKDFAALPWLVKTTTDFLWLITTDDMSVDADLLIDFLAEQRDYIAESGK